MTTSPLEGEVPNDILAQLDLLEKTSKENKRLAAEFRAIDPAEKCEELDGEIAKLGRYVAQLKGLTKKERLKNAALADKITRDQRVAHQVMKSHESLTKNPQFGRVQSVEYMLDVTTQHEKSFMENKSTVDKLRQTICSLQSESDEDANRVSRKDLLDHIQRFDHIYTTVSGQVCELDEEAERLKDAYLEQRRKLYGRFGTDPFEQRKERRKIVDAFSSLKGIDAFPSSNAILSLSEFLPKQAPPPQPQFGAAPTFGSITAGTTPSLFGSTRPLGTTAQTSSMPFSFNPSASAASNSLFGKRSATSPFV